MCNSCSLSVLKRKLELLRKQNNVHKEQKLKY